MRNKNNNGRCEKVMLSKCSGVCKTYSSIQAAYAQILNERADICCFECNVELSELEGNIKYTTDFLCTKTDGTMMVRECISLAMLSRPSYAKMLDISRNYWLSRSIDDWGIVVDDDGKDHT